MYCQIYGCPARPLHSTSSVWRPGNPPIPPNVVPFQTLRPLSLGKHRESGKRIPSFLDREKDGPKGDRIPKFYRSLTHKRYESRRQKGDRPVSFIKWSGWIMWKRWRKRLGKKDTSTNPQTTTISPLYDHLPRKGVNKSRNKKDNFTNGS